MIAIPFAGASWYAFRPALIIKLRAQIDPEAYALRGSTVVEDAGSDVHSRPGVFDRHAAYELYQALLGDVSIQAVLKDKPVLLFVPSGPLTSLPPALLVTAPSADGSAGDADPCDASDLAEPALVLAAGVKPEDELLLAS